MKIESLTHHGMGRATDGTLVPRVLAGEEIELLTDGSARILTPSADRVAAPCRHFKSCGGCAMQHGSDELVSRWKMGIVETALRAHGIETDIRGIHTSPARSRRRAKFSGRRTKKGALVGFHARGSDMVVAVPDCMLLVPQIAAVIPALEELTIIAATRKSEVALTVTDTPNGPDVHVGTDKELTGELRIELANFAQRHKLARLVWADEPVVTILPPVQVFGGAEVAPPPSAFLQATRDGEGALLEAVQETVGKSKKIVDLFSGCGTFSLPLAAKAEVHAVEGFGPMLDALDAGWRHAKGLKKVTTEARDLFRRPLEVDELKKYNAAVIDPPRAGAEAQVDRLADCDIPIVAMVSCNPVTFARDAKVLLDGGYTLNWIKVVDQFRWSPHVELAASFTRS